MTKRKTREISPWIPILTLSSSFGWLIHTFYMSWVTVGYFSGSNPEIALLHNATDFGALALIGLTLYFMLNNPPIDEDISANKDVEKDSVVELAKLECELEKENAKIRKRRRWF